MTFEPLCTGDPYHPCTLGLSLHKLGMKVMDQSKGKSHVALNLLNIQA